MRKTKIVCTIGPACNTKPMLLKMIDAGMDVARVNMSHGTHEDLAVVFQTIREAIAESGKNVAILLDTKGPEVRVATFANGKATLQGRSCDFLPEARRHLLQRGQRRNRQRAVA